MLKSHVSYTNNLERVLRIFFKHLYYTHALYGRHSIDELDKANIMSTMT